MKLHRLVALAACAVLAAPLWAQQVAVDPDLPPWVAKLAVDPKDPALEAFKARRKAELAFTKQVRQIKAKHLRAVNNPKMLTQGIAEIKKITDPAAFPVLIEELSDQAPAVRAAVLDIFSEAQSQEGDAALAWCAIFAKDAGFRSHAKDRLIRRVASAGIHDKIKMVVYEGVRCNRDTEVANAAQLAQALNMWQAIPWLIPAQLGRASDTEERAGVLAWIAIGTQTSFISDLEPIVAPYAVAFDPQISVITTGTLVVVYDAVVITYRFDVREALNGLTKNTLGSDTTALGFDMSKWSGWRRDVFAPFELAQMKKAGKG